MAMTGEAGGDGRCAVDCDTACTGEARYSHAHGNAVVEVGGDSDIVGGAGQSFAGVSLIHFDTAYDHSYQKKIIDKCRDQLSR